MSKLLFLAGKEVNRQREMQLLTFEYSGNTFDCSDRSLMQMMMYIKSSELGWFPEAFVWRTLDNVDVPMSASDLKQMFLSAVQHRYNVYTSSFNVKASLADMDYDEIVSTLGLP